MNVDSSNLEARLIAARSNLQTLQSTHGDASLALARGEADDAELDALEEEIRSAEKVIRRLEAAVAAQAEANTEAAREARHQARVDARQRVAELGGKMEALALQVVKQVEGLGPLLAEFEALSKERSNAASDAIRFSAMATGRTEREWAAVGERAALRQGAVPSAVLAALWRTGITKVLSVEYAGATLPPPDFYGPFGQGDLTSALKEALHRVQDQLDAQIDQIQKRYPK